MDMNIDFDQLSSEDLKILSNRINIIINERREKVFREKVRDFCIALNELRETFPNASCWVHYEGDSIDILDLDEAVILEDMFKKEDGFKK